jgi:hypothetical protein
MAATQFLEAYPAAGTQTGIAAAPMILWAFICIVDGIVGLQTTAAKLFTNIDGRLRLDAIIGGATLLLLTGFSVSRAVDRPFPSAASGLRGADWLHLPAKQTTEFQSITRNVGANCKVLFTLPGMASFNLWSGVPTPNGWNLTAWMEGIGLDRQAEILGLLKSNPQSCAIINRQIMRWWGQGDASAETSPLVYYITTEMPEIDVFGDYEIHVHPDRRSLWISRSVPGSGQ